MNLFIYSYSEIDLILQVPCRALIRVANLSRDNADFEGKEWFGNADCKTNEALDSFMLECLLSGVGANKNSLGLPGPRDTN